MRREGEDLGLRGEEIDKRGEIYALAVAKRRPDDKGQKEREGRRGAVSEDDVE